MIANRSKDATLAMRVERSLDRIARIGHIIPFWKEHRFPKRDDEPEDWYKSYERMSKSGVWDGTQSFDEVTRERPLLENIHRKCSNWSDKDIKRLGKIVDQ